MTTRIFLMRHVDTANTQEDRYTGMTDMPLSEEGQTHASELATRLANFKLDAVYASPLQRARNTAQAIAQTHTLPVITIDGLREIDHGHWNGMTLAEVLSKYADEYSAYLRDPVNYRPQGGESSQDVLERAVPALLGIVRAHPDQLVAVVAHSVTNRLLIGYFVGIDPARHREAVAQRPACLNVLDFDSEKDVRLSLLNDVSHYIIGAPPHTPYVV
jgi:probable phosphoglycerate mutase